MRVDDVSGMGTVAIHAGRWETAEHAHITPIFATSAYTFDSAEQGMNRFSGKEAGFTYSRFGNPTVAAAAQLIEALEAFNLKNERGEPLQVKALLHASGQAAMATMFLSNLSAGDAVLSGRSVYGGTYEFLQNLISRFGIRSRFADMRDLSNLADILSHDPTIKLVHLETPANPTMQCTDMEAVCKLAKQFNCLVTADNTFATPYLQQPFQYGVDFVFHSTTKFLNGHGSAIGGVLIGRDGELMNKRVTQTFKLLGSNSNPFDAFLLIQGVKTLAVRMDRHCSNALAVARFLSAHPAVAVVNYNGLPSHPDHAVSCKQMKQHGAVLSFELEGGYESAVRFIDKLRICVRAVSLGTVDTLVSHPASMSHAGMLRAEREAAGISDGLIRMSVGLEDISDLLSDLDQALL
ncbi:MAG: aminotransferase class I/II-fold pyridoxal phosphate-dependent enzyme [Williamsia sp.]|nr:aminotransferase class I/II-fold pyridoxal phosphate-dependent enzyme [Williamsia sp.]